MITVTWYRVDCPICQAQHAGQWQLGRVLFACPRWLSTPITICYTDGGMTPLAICSEAEMERIRNPALATLSMGSMTVTLHE